MRATLAALIALPLLAACISQPPQRTCWRKVGATAEQFEVDRGICTAQAFSGGTNNLISAAIVQDSCLRGRGWSVVNC